MSNAEYHWLWVLCLLGLDYFSTLAYQPSITYQETQRLGPLATAAVVLVTLFGALPVYCYLAGRSPGGQGSLGILDKLIRGWRGKTLVLILLGFAATDFTLLKSLSLADAAVHVLNQQDGLRLEGAKHVVAFVKDCATEYCGDDAAHQVTDQLIVTILLGVIATLFWFLLRQGFTRKVMVCAVPLVGIYLVVSGIVIGSGLWLLWQNPALVSDWFEQVSDGRIELAGTRPASDGWGLVVLLSFLALPKLALGLSGFEMSMILMPHVNGTPGEQPPRTRIRNTRKVLVLAALIMGLYLLGSTFVATLLIPAEQFGLDGQANNRALAYLAHGGPTTLGGESALPLAGPILGTAYDIVTVLVLCLAGTSVMTAIAVLMPLFLSRFGMEFRWAQRWGLLLFIFSAIHVLVIVYFQANVDDQRGAYATGVLVLIASAAVVTVLDKCKDYARAPSPGLGVARLADVAYYGLIAVVFTATMVAVALRSPSGLAIAFLFIAAILGMSILSRAWRADELRTVGYGFKDEQSEFLWQSLRLSDFPILIPVRPGREVHDQKEREIRAAHNLAPEADIVFLEICVDDPSEFFQKLMIEVVREHNRYIIRVSNCVSTAHAIAAIAMEMSRKSKPPSVHFGWPEMDMLSASWSYLAFGEGNIPWKVRELIHRAEKDPARRPRVIVG